MNDLTFDLDLLPEAGLDAAFHLPNQEGEDFRRIFAQTTNERSPLSMMVKLVEVHHGEMIHEEEEAHGTLLVFEFRFQSRLLNHRYKSASVTLEFFDKGGVAKRDPAVIKLAPDRMHYLNRTTYDRNIKYGASAGANAGNDMAGAKADAHWEVELVKPLRYKSTLTGSPWYSKGKLGLHNGVRWTMAENEGEADGIPTFLQAAVLLKRSHAGAFFARLRVESKVDPASAGRRMLPMTTDRDKVIDDVVFRPGTVQVRESSVTGIKPKDLERMHELPISQYFKINLSEEDPLTPPPPASGSATDKQAPVASVPDVPPIMPVEATPPAPVPTLSASPKGAPPQVVEAPEAAPVIQNTEALEKPAPPATTSPVLVEALSRQQISTSADNNVFKEAVAYAAAKAASAAKAAAHAAEEAARAAEAAAQAALGAREAAAQAAEVVQRLGAVSAIEGVQ